MAAVNKIDGNVVGLRYSKETSIGVADVSAVWREFEPNSYADFGQQITTVARSPITSDRQKKKGTLTDLDASGGFSADVTQEALPDIGQGVFYAAIRDKDELSVAIADTTLDDYQPASGGDAYLAGDLLFAQGFDAAANNGLKEVVSGAAASIVVTANLTTAAAQAGTLRRVGFQFAVGDLDVTTTGDFVTLTTTAKDLTQLGLIPGEWIFIGGDVTGAAGDQFTNAANNGFKRVRSISANAIVLDKSDLAMITEADTTQLMKIFFASRILKNESDPALQVRSSYQLERTLGAPDDATPTYDHQAEYLVGAVPSQLQLNIATADKLTFDLSFMGTDMEQVPAGVGSLKAGTRPALLSTDAYNSTSDISRINMSVVSTTSEAPTPLYAFIQELNITIDNNLSANKAVSVLGAFDITAGMFGVSGNLTAYLGDAAVQSSIRQNADITVDAHFVKSNQGISLDMPLLTIGDGRPDVQSDAPIMLPISFDAAAGDKVSADYDHTLMLMFWDYLPDAADL